MNTRAKAADAEQEQELDSGQFNQGQVVAWKGYPGQRGSGTRRAYVVFLKDPEAEFLEKAAVGTARERGMNEPSVALTLESLVRAARFSFKQEVAEGDTQKRREGYETGNPVRI